MTSTPRSPLPSDVPPGWEALARYRAGESSPDEAQRIAAWLAAHPADRALLETLDAAVQVHLVDPVQHDQPDTEAALRRVRTRMTPPGGAPAVPAGQPALRLVRSTPGASRVVPASGPRRWVLGALVAAAAVAAVAIPLTRPRTAAVERGAAGSVVTTAVGLPDSVRLPDGTRVVLGPDSRLAVSEAFGAAAREVTLDGVASFTVAHDARRPFTVRAGGAAIRDIGTVFTVRNDSVAGGHHVLVSVTEGIVALRQAASRDSGVILAAGDRGALHRDGTISTERRVRTEEDAAWTTGRLVYSETPLAIVRTDLRRWYGIDVQVPDSSLAALRLTATFDDLPADRVLDLLALAIGADLERRGNIAILRARRTP